MGEGAISGGNPVLIAERYWPSAWRCSVLSHRGLSASSDRAGSRYRLLWADLAVQLRIPCAKVSSSERRRGQEASGPSDHLEAWAAR